MMEKTCEIKKICALFLLLCLHAPAARAQVAFGTDQWDNGNLLVEPDSYAAPSAASGVIVPRVQQLSTTQLEPDGLIVYLDNPAPPLATGEENGFYYWDAVQKKWIPFMSRFSASIEDLTVFSASATGFANAQNCIYYNTATDNLMKSDVNLDVLDINDPGLCELTADGRLKIKKKGWYYIQINITLTKDTSPAGVRDIICIQLLRNGNYVYFDPPTNGIIFRGFNSYAGLNLIGQTIVAQGAVYCQQEEILSLSCELIYTDRAGGDAGLNPVNPNRVSGKYTITTGTQATLGGRYLGDF
jgi:hypothetical protein